jgi:hypothetical protein
MEERQANVKIRRGRKARKHGRRKHGNFYHNLPTSEYKTAVEATKTFCIALFTSSFDQPFHKRSKSI